jgi:hypothetical protein
LPNEEDNLAFPLEAWHAWAKDSVM